MREQTSQQNRASENNYNLMEIDEIFTIDRAKLRELHKEYLNTGLANLLGLLDFDKLFIRARGTSVWDVEGREYLDFLGGYGALALGHNHPKIQEALEKVQEIPSLLQASLGSAAAILAHNIAQITPGDLKHSFFGNSGAEAVEGALKLARIATGRSHFLYCQNSFHGKSFGALSVTGRSKYQKPFRPLLEGCVEIPYNNLELLEKALIDYNIAAFIVEPIQGEGGIIAPNPGYLTAAKKLCAKHGTLIIVDEIQTGFGRTGSMFACEAEGVTPDILCISKSLGGGAMPIGAFVTTEKIWRKAYGSSDNAMLHTSTYGGNTKACAVAIAAIKLICQEGLVEQAREKGIYLLEKLKKLQEKYPLVKEVRGRGLMIGIEFNQPGSFAKAASLGIAGKISDKYLGSFVAGELLNKYGIITAYTLNNPNVIRLEPPLTVTYEEMDKVLQALEAVFKNHANFFSIATPGVKTVLKSMFRK